MFDRVEIRGHAFESIERLSIKASPDDQVRTLSGDSIQKVLLARVLVREPRVLVVSQPTRGLDIGASGYVRQELLDMRGQGTAVVLAALLRNATPLVFGVVGETYTERAGILNLGIEGTM